MKQDQPDRPYSIETYTFDKDINKKLQENDLAKGFWPSIYILIDKILKLAYVGESTNVLARMQTHLSDSNRALPSLVLIYSNEFNKSAALDIEAWLIRYVSGDRVYKLLNSTAGLVFHEYFQRESYFKTFENIWKELQDEKYGIAVNDIKDITNSDLFIYSPYKALSEDQYASTKEIINALVKNPSGSIFVEGGAGTGKTILAVFLIKLLVTDLPTLFNVDDLKVDEMGYLTELKRKFPSPRIALVVPMPPLRATLQNVFREVDGLDAGMVIGPSEAAASEDKYDILIVDESHRLRQRRNLPNYDIFDNTSRHLGMDKTKTELDWLIHRSEHRIMFYDAEQSVMPADVSARDFEKELQNATKLVLRSQMRVKGGTGYINYVKKLLKVSLAETPVYNNKDYEFLLFDSVEALLDKIRERDKEVGLARTLAGFAWPRTNKKNKDARDIVIGNITLPWNSDKKGWIHTINAINEIGSIHTSQGYDLQYAGVIFGNDIGYDDINDKIIIRRDNYYDKLGKRGMLKNEAEIRKNIINTYTTLLTRGIKGTYVYVCDPALRKYFSEHMQAFQGPQPARVMRPKHRIVPKDEKQSDHDVPFYDISAAAGGFSGPQETSDRKWITLPEGTDMKEDYFVCSVVGESMNEIIPNGTLCLFKKITGSLKEDEIVLVEDLDINDPGFSAGYTVKRFYSQKTLTIRGKEYKTITLKPMSTLEYPDIVLKKDKNRKLDVLGVFVKVLEFGV